MSHSSKIQCDEEEDPRDLDPGLVVCICKFNYAVVQSDCKYCSGTGYISIEDEDNNHG